MVLAFESVDDIQTKASERDLPVVLFIMLYKVVTTFESFNQIFTSMKPFQKEAIEQYI